MKTRTRIIAGLAALLALSLFGILAIYRHQIRQSIQTIAVEMRTTPFSWILVVALLSITSIPPMIGFTFTATLTGFIYGVPFGFPIAIIGAFIGSMICFHLIRQYNFARFVRLSPSRQDKYHAIQEAIEQGGLRIMLLIRLSPIPWPITNMLLSLLPTVTTRQYTMTAFLSSFKLCLEVWIGSQLADISNPDLPPSAHRVAVFTMLGSVMILVVVAWWLYRLSMQKVKSIAERKKQDSPSYIHHHHQESMESSYILEDEEKSVATLALPITRNTLSMKMK
ncbi:snare associated Golgi protein-domain-containing protein [Halteromyces radiatus]|uniref:snare associated Golgi protein-domain-containing protein n=1 Tax=Halteromyces radiatus TaxID=101107 RepID=UPI002220CFC5|nr:snare associated Golgi protein-domain-containing protein [Halteromyces radiatus]KAI8089522.1 snare associated Golgi protein-domain-containing protein [Halteromyces radiatus]